VFRDFWTLLTAAQAWWSGDYDLSIQLRTALTPDEEAVEIVRLISRLDLEGMNYAARGDNQRAIEVLHSGLSICERIGELPYRARILNALGWVYGELQDFEPAISFNRRSLEAADALPAPDAEISSNARLNLGDDYLALGRLDEAEEQYRIVERVVRQPTPQERWILWSYSQHFFHSFGELWLARGDATQALSLADECIELAERTGRKKNIVKGRRLRGEALMVLGDAAQAREEFDAALAIARPLGNPPQLWKTLVALGDLRVACGERTQARAAYEEAVEVIDGVAAALDDADLRDTFVQSPHVQSIREKLAAS
jgi:tetratricopeptide (TPR) repeat protein